MSDSKTGSYLVAKYDIDKYNNIICIEEGYYNSLNEAIDRVEELRDGMIVLYDNKVVYPLYR